MSNGCSGCHGLGGGGGMGKPILDDVWEFGSDDETLYKLIKGQIPKQTMPTGAGLPDEQVTTRPSPRAAMRNRALAGHPPQKFRG